MDGNSASAASDPVVVVGILFLCHPLRVLISHADSLQGISMAGGEDMQVFEAIMYQPRPRIHACLTAPCHIGARCGLQAEAVKAIFPLLPAA